MADRVAMSRALISVADKRGLDAFASALAARGVEILSTGGTAQALANAGIACTDVGAETGFNAILGGRVKTLHPGIQAPLLARREVPEDMHDLDEMGAVPIDLVVVNLYPFEQTWARGADPAACVEQIDIGGPTLIRAAAKNHAWVTVIVDPADYDTLLHQLDTCHGATDASFRQRMAAEAFACTAAHDAVIAAWAAEHAGYKWPRHHTLAGRRAAILRYGENPHQGAAFFRTMPAIDSAAWAEQLQGRGLSFNNLNDADAAYRLVQEFDPDTTGPVCAIVKHASSCGVARGASAAEACARAHAADPESAFGGIVALNCQLDEPGARVLSAHFVEVVIAPAIDPEARAILGEKGRVRLLTVGGNGFSPPPERSMHPLTGGFMVQEVDLTTAGAVQHQCVTVRRPDQAELEDLLFALMVAKHARSNAVVLARNGATCGIGAGQTSRVASVRLAAQKCIENAQTSAVLQPCPHGLVLASDGFFPFADGIHAAAESGVRAIVQPGGARRDEEVIAAADASGMAMLFTGIRHFRH